MRNRAAPRGQRVDAVGSSAFDADRADYTDGFALERGRADAASSERWARASLEDAPLALRWFIIAGWRIVLRLRLGPRPSPDYVLGWKIIGRAPEETVLELRSSFLTAHLVFRLDGQRVIWSTFVQYDRRLAGFVWPPVSLLHRRIVPFALRGAASRLHQ